MNPEEFLKTDEASEFKDIAFTSDQWQAIYTWMSEFSNCNDVTIIKKTLLEAYKDGFKSALDSLHAANE